ncbi:MAG: hypothetical protein HOV67_18385 [Kribbellaceae bacterium]|nr:hypothetical protein [Kribbellaceae bacterium]
MVPDVARGDGGFVRDEDACLVAVAGEDDGFVGRDLAGQEFEEFGTGAHPVGGRSVVETFEHRPDCGCLERIGDGDDGEILLLDVRDHRGRPKSA